MSRILNSFFSVSCLLLFYCSCKKQNDFTVLGKWTGNSVISRTSITNLFNNITSYRSDTFSVATGSIFSLEINKDNLNTIGKFVYPGGNYLSLELTQTVYKVDNGKLSFFQNPYTTAGIFNGTNHTGSIIKVLTNTSLTLYDTDTSNFNPLVIKETWSSFSR